MKRTSTLGGLAAIALLCAGCYVTAAPAPPMYVEVESPPPNIERYQQTVYEGRTVYYVGDRWYYRHGRRWAYYRQEPPPLRHVRTRVQRPYVQQAPPAPR